MVDLFTEFQGLQIIYLKPGNTVDKQMDSTHVSKSILFNPSFSVFLNDSEELLSDQEYYAFARSPYTGVAAQVPIHFESDRKRALIKKL